MSHLSRREALASVAAGVATLAACPLSFAEDKDGDKKANYYTLPKLPYDYDALKESIDEETMRIHHTKHHQAYIDNAKKALAATPKLLAMPPAELLADIKQVPEKVRQAAINNVGGHSNHSIFWTVMGPKGGSPAGALAKAIDARFGSLDKFQKELSEKAVTQFGSGWAWLVVNKKKELQTIQRPNQNSPYMDGLTPILGIDVWEHAYYLKYKNLRPKYVEAWWKVVNWTEAGERYASAMKG